jgi:K+/H+ antiporter YhaU regulatory subunit KhtT|tara:strand:+ start:93 stop:473 length:381 start_codon:yes stop_codon:yes gene_type:complete
MADDEKETYEDENPVHDEIEFDEEVESLPPVVIVEDNSEKRNKLLNEEDWGDSIQELHLESINKSLNQINSNLDKFKYVSENLSKISDEFEEANFHLKWIEIALLGMLVLMILGVLSAIITISNMP